MMIRSFKSTIKEQVTAGGNSGAFFFFSKDQQFIAKSCTVEEFTHICESASKMAEYWKKNPSSFITKVHVVFESQKAIKYVLLIINVLTCLHIFRYMARTS